MRVIVGLVFVLLLVAGVMMLVAEIRRRRAVEIDRDETVTWGIEEHSDGEGITITVEAKGEPPLLIGYVPVGALDFDDRLTEYRVRAEDKLVTLGQRRLPRL